MPLGIPGLAGMMWSATLARSAQPATQQVQLSRLRARSRSVCHCRVLYRRSRSIGERENRTAGLTFSVSSRVGTPPRPGPRYGARLATMTLITVRPHARTLRARAACSCARSVRRSLYGFRFGKGGAFLPPKGAFLVAMTDSFSCPREAHGTPQPEQTLPL
jgi:hypothetical protein